MKKFFLIFLAFYSLAFTFHTPEVTGPVAVLAAPLVYIEPIDVVLAMLGGLHADKTLRKRSLGKQPKDKNPHLEPNNAA